MPSWTPTQEWKGRTVFIIGGGPSLRTFDFARLFGHPTIGCNAAFKLGADICNICFFSDAPWFQRYYDELARFKGRVVTHCEELRADEPWLLKMERRVEGLHHDGLGFGCNSGCSAINLALLLGAKKVVLLGFDCKPGEDHSSKPNWHPYHTEVPNPEVFTNFNSGHEAIARDLPVKFPHATIVNATPGSALRCYPFGDVADYLKRAA